MAFFVYILVSFDPILDFFAVESLYIILLIGTKTTIFVLDTLKQHQNNNSFLHLLKAL
jgi:hypothetical protein